MSYNYMSVDSTTARTDYIWRGYWSAGRAKQAAVVARPEYAEFTIFPAFLAVAPGIGRILRNKRLAVRAYLVSFLNVLNGFFLGILGGLFDSLPLAFVGKRLCGLHGNGILPCFLFRIKPLQAFALVFLFPLFTAVSQEVNPEPEGITAGKTEYKSQQQVVPGDGAGENLSDDAKKVDGHFFLLYLFVAAIGFLIGNRLGGWSEGRSFDRFVDWLDRRYHDCNQEDLKCNNKKQPRKDG